MTMALVTTYNDPNAIAAQQTADQIVIEAQKKASDLSAVYGVPSIRVHDKLGITYLVAARRTKAGVNLTYRSETAIINNYHASLNNYHKSLEA